MEKILEKIAALRTSWQQEATQSNANLNYYNGAVDAASLIMQQLSQEEAANESDSVPKKRTAKKKPSAAKKR